MQRPRDLAQRRKEFSCDTGRTRLFIAHCSSYRIFGYFGVKRSNRSCTSVQASLVYNASFNNSFIPLPYVSTCKEGEGVKLLLELAQYRHDVKNLGYVA